MKTFYTYIWSREDGSPYYVGKGSYGEGRRVGDRGRAFGGRHYVPRPLDEARIQVIPCKDEVMALLTERRFIRIYGRKDLGTGILRNLTDGGEGLSGHIFSAEHRRKISEGLKGVRKSPEHIEKMREKGKNQIHSEQHKHNQSLATKGRPSNRKGIAWPKSEEVRLKISKSKAGSAPTVGNHIRHHIKGWYSKKTKTNHLPKINPGCAWCMRLQNVSA